LARTAREVVSIDPHDGRATGRPHDTLAEFCANLRRYGVLSWVSSVVGVLPSALANIRGLFDLVFIDGDHDAASVERDVLATLPLLARDGLIAFHDHDDDHPGVQRAVDVLVDRGGAIIGSVDSLAVVDPNAWKSAPSLLEI
jgi:hypothetical protein